LDQFCDPMAGMLIIHRAIATSNRLNLIVEIDQDLIQRQLAMQHHPARIERLSVIHHTALLVDRLKDAAKYLVRAKDISLHNWLADFFDHARIREVRRIVNEQSLTPRRHDLIDHTWGSGDDIHVVLAPESFLNDFHVQQAKEAAAKTETK